MHAQCHQRQPTKEGISIIPVNELRKRSALLINYASEKICRPARPSDLKVRILFQRDRSFVFSLGISSRCSPHLTIAGRGWCAA
jgi:hypothetical protein